MEMMKNLMVLGVGMMTWSFNYICLRFTLH